MRNLIKFYFVEILHDFLNLKIFLKWLTVEFYFSPFVDPTTPHPSPLAITKLSRILINR